MSQIEEQDELRVEVDESQEDGVHKTYDIATYPSDFTLSGFVDMWKNKDITIPGFQRDYVWNIKQASLLMESFLLGLPVPSVFFYIDDKNKNLVIDGQQRILSTIFYFSGFFGDKSSSNKPKRFRLQGLDRKSPYYRKSFEELAPSDQRKLKNTVLRAINIRQLAPKGDDNTSIYHIFKRLNTGGTTLKSQEIRNVVFRGGFIEVLRSLNNDPNWRLLLGKSTPHKHQVDVELVLRIFALRNGAENYKRPMNEFLNKAMQKNQNGETKDVREFQSLFAITSYRIIKALGKKPFHLRGNQLSTSALDSVFCTLLNYHDQLPDNLDERYQRLIEDTEFEEATTIGTTNVAIVKQRFQLAKEYLVE